MGSFGLLLALFNGLLLQNRRKTLLETFKGVCRNNVALSVFNFEPGKGISRCHLNPNHDSLF